MAQGDRLESTDTVLRYIKKSLQRGNENGQLIASGDAFALEEGHDAISVVCIEKFKFEKFHKNLFFATLKFCQTRPLTDFKPNSLFAYVRVSDIKLMSTKHRVETEIYHDPEKNNKAHSEIKFSEENFALYKEIVDSNSIKYITLENIAKNINL